MAKYVYPAVFTKEENGQYSVNFPDIKNCFTDGNDLVEAMEMAEDVLAMMLTHYEDHQQPFAEPSKTEDIKLDERSFVNLISCDTTRYRKMTDNKAIKKTLTIPSWLNYQAENAGVNFSQILQEALKEKLGLE